MHKSTRSKHSTNLKLHGSGNIYYRQSTTKVQQIKIFWMHLTTDLLVGLWVGFVPCGNFKAPKAFFIGLYGWAPSRVNQIGPLGQPRCSNTAGDNLVGDGLLHADARMIKIQILVLYQVFFFFFKFLKKKSYNYYEWKGKKYLFIHRWKQAAEPHKSLVWFQYFCLCCIRFFNGLRNKSYN